MADLGSPCDGNSATAGILESDHVVDGAAEDAIIGGAFGVGFGGAPARGRRVNACSFELMVTRILLMSSQSIGSVVEHTLA